MADRSGELGEESEDGEEEQERQEEPSAEPASDQAPAGGGAGAGRAAPRYLVEFMRSFGQMRANDSGWPTFDGRFVSYPRFRREWGAYRQTYHAAVGDDLAARTLRDKCLQGDARQMVSHLDDLYEMWETLDACYEIRSYKCLVGSGPGLKPYLYFQQLHLSFIIH
jgi:hypothetical protein